MSFYTSMLRIVENHIAPLAGRVGSQRHILAIRDGFIAAMPFIIVGSILLIVANPPFEENTTFAPGLAWLHFAKAHFTLITQPYYMSMGLMSVFVAIATAYSLAQSYQSDGLTAGLLSLMAFLVAASPQIEGKMSLDFLGGEGVFTALICAIWSVELIRLLKKYHITVKMPEQVPPAIARSFELLLPVAGIFITVYPVSLIIQGEFHILLPEAVMYIFQPIISVSDSLPAIIIAILLSNLLWFSGIHGDSIVTGLINPLCMANIATNAAPIVQGSEPTQILSVPYWSFFVCLGGSGSTLVLCIMYLRSRSVHLKTMGRLSIVPSLFNINEPVLFGSPVVMNPVLFLPLMIVPVLNAIIAWVLMQTHVISMMVVMSPWTTPAPLGALISSAWDYRAALCVIFLMVLDFGIWYPFFKVYEKQLVEKERLEGSQVVAH
ncbi:PTS cellobiose transporter subunit IIC [Superficieibacter electus]|uniref:Permease IIC component n=1 Tax=Superficieibacter electus TaxID=2022662 RepID=A0A2P5GR53_9ENTR|nr:PTS sugar transporter subunit IIC [Superficieibacter electus]POP42822.1 PTS cellobiose transporter subunit IIC [Superficieibacter electus]POP49027.1 PTS cellobiose transporter subunit IIC [Superficieibacter electus]